MNAATTPRGCSVLFARPPYEDAESVWTDPGKSFRVADPWQLMRRNLPWSVLHTTLTTCFAPSSHGSPHTGTRKTLDANDQSTVCDIYLQLKTMQREHASVGPRGSAMVGGPLPPVVVENVPLASLFRVFLAAVLVVADCELLREPDGVPPLHFPLKPDGTERICLITDMLDVHNTRISVFFDLQKLYHILRPFGLSSAMDRTDGSYRYHSNLRVWPLPYHIALPGKELPLFPAHPTPLQPLARHHMDRLEQYTGWCIENYLSPVVDDVLWDTGSKYFETLMMHRLTYALYLLVNTFPGHPGAWLPSYAQSVTENFTRLKNMLMENPYPLVGVFDADDIPNRHCIWHLTKTDRLRRLLIDTLIDGLDAAEQAGATQRAVTDMITNTLDPWQNGPPPVDIPDFETFCKLPLIINMRRQIGRGLWGTVRPLVHHMLFPPQILDNTLKRDLRNIVGPLLDFADLEPAPGEAPSPLEDLVAWFIDRPAANFEAGQGWRHAIDAAFEGAALAVDQAPDVANPLRNATWGKYMSPHSIFWTRYNTP